jgi:putative selenate reductase FAD-binding subunit
MIQSYYRPTNLEDALEHLAQPDTIPLGGGTVINTPAFRGADSSYSVVDLQALGLNQIAIKGNNLEIGATVTLQQLLEEEHTPESLRAAIRLEAAINIRNMATVAGMLVACDGRSPFATAILALDAYLLMTEHGKRNTSVSLGNFLPIRDISHRLITAITIPTNAQLGFEYVARTPADRPIVCAAVAQWPSGRIRLALGGYGKAPLLAMDGTGTDGLETAARNTFHEAADEWANAEYRADVAATLARRALTISPH